MKINLLDNESLLTITCPALRLLLSGVPMPVTRWYMLKMVKIHSFPLKDDIQINFWYKK